MGPYGVLTHGAEARLVIPLGPGLVGEDLVATLELSAVSGHRRFDIVVNESRVGTAAAGPAPTSTSVRIDASVAGRFSPMEVALRAPAGDRLRGRGFLDFQLSWIRFERAQPALRVDVELW